MKKPIYKRWWFWVVIVIAIGAIGSGGEDANQLETDNIVSIEQSDTSEPVDAEETETEEKQKEEEPKETPKDVKQDIPKEHRSALKKADIYANEMHMSKAALYDQLISEHGENFSEEAAQYAVDNVEADWKENALQKAIIYQDGMAMSPNAIYDQLISEYGEQFTEEEANYAIENLPK